MRVATLVLLMLAAVGCGSGRVSAHGKLSGSVSGSGSGLLSKGAAASCTEPNAAAPLAVYGWDPGSRAKIATTAVDVRHPVVDDEQSMRRMGVSHLDERAWRSAEGHGRHAAERLVPAPAKRAAHRYRLGSVGRALDLNRRLGLKERAASARAQRERQVGRLEGR